MKLLLDENISFRVLKSIAPFFQGSIHVSDENDTVKEDLEIFEYARTNGFAILTIDEDFYGIQLLKGHPRQKLSGSDSETQVICESPIS